MLIVVRDFDYCGFDKGVIVGFVVENDFVFV